MVKKFSKFELANFKRTAENVNKLLTKRKKLEEAIAKLQKDYDEVVNDIELNDAATLAKTGYHTEDIIKKVVTPTDKVNKEGKTIFKTTFEFIYPDTIVPPVGEPIEEETEDTEESVETNNEF